MVDDQMPSWHRFWPSFCDRALNRTIGSDRGPGPPGASVMAAARPGGACFTSAGVPLRPNKVTKVLREGRGHCMRELV